MIPEEEYFRGVIKKFVRDEMVTLLGAKEFSKRLHKRDDRKDIDKEIESLSEKATNLLISKLKNAGYLTGGKEPSKDDFNRIWKDTVNECFGESSESRDNSE